MPIKRVQFPDGSIKRVEVPEGATNEQIIAFVQSQWQPEPQQWQPRKRSLDDLKQAARVHDATDGMSRAQVAFAGAGKSLYDTGRGLSQLGGLVLDKIAPRQASVADLVAGRDVSRDAENRREQDRIEELDQSLMGNPYGLGGNIVGNVAQVVTPGVVAKLASKVPAFVKAAPALEKVSRVSLPNTIKGGAAQGAVLGLMQPVGTGESRALNTIGGTLFGGAGVALPRAVGAAYRATRRGLLAGSGAERAAARTIRDSVDDPSILLQSNPSIVPGSTRTLFDETLLPGIARLETKARGAYGDQWVQLDAANAASREAAIRQFAGDEASLAQAVAARTKATAPLYAAANKVKGVDTSRLLTQIDRLAEAQEGRPAVQGALKTVRGLLSRESEGLPDLGQDKMATIANVRLTINDMLAGKYGGESGAALAGSRALMAVKSGLDRVAAKASPEFEQATGLFRQHSAGINRMEAGQGLLSRGSAGYDPITQSYPLTPGKFGQQVKNLDQAVQTATGFRKAKAANVFQPQDLKTIAAINDDLARSGKRLAYGNGGGSHTASQMEVGMKLAVKSLARKAPWVGPWLESMEAASRERVAAALSEMLQNPAEYRRVIATLPPEEAGLVEQAFVRLGATGGAVAVPSLK